MTTKRINILDLPIATIRDIEEAVGAKMTEWPEGVTSIADLYGRIYAAGTGTPMEEVEAMSLRTLSALVNATGDEEEEDPT